MAINSRYLEAVGDLAQVPDTERKDRCPLCGFSPCLHQCKIGMTWFDVKLGEALLHDIGVTTGLEKNDGSTTEKGECNDR